MANQTTLVPITTIEGERFDSVASRCYGDGTRTEEIINSNPGLLLNRRLPGGIVIYVPMLSVEDGAVVPNELLPPWKRK